jgi:hypothetical protein
MTPSTSSELTHPVARVRSKASGPRGTVELTGLNIRFAQGEMQPGAARPRSRQLRH